MEVQCERCPLVESALSVHVRRPARWPYFYRGWTPALSRACEQIGEMLPAGKHGFRWVQIRADGGCGLFVYMLAERRSLVVDIQGESRRAMLLGGADDRAAAEISANLDRVVLEAERVTGASCMVCGERAQLSFHFGHALTLCEGHSPDTLNEAGEEGLEGFWRESIEWEEASST